ncbi:MAG: glycosyltransferase [Candidatus Woesebacteria bacterium]|jgi:cellulose synthase/poly-beta-1,6-N-acetylglucosamine synthase-like glycosyltransferase
MKISIIIPVKKINYYITQETIPAIKKQSYKNWELIVVVDKAETVTVNKLTIGQLKKNKLAKKNQLKKQKIKKCIFIISSWPKTGPADKRDLAAQKASGEIIAFLDDDAYPSKNWLKNAAKYFGNKNKNKKLAAVCGPGLTPPHDNQKQKIAGLFWQSWLGAAGAGTYRSRAEKKRLVDDYPSFNLIVRKKEFLAVDGFNSQYWPGEDTKLCHDLVYQLKKEIIYDPSILVYHHRREIFGPHLKQISRFGFQRGLFTKIFPKTSKRLVYFLPLIFFIGVMIGPILIIIWKKLGFNYLYKLTILLYLLSLALYLLPLLITGIMSTLKQKNFKIFPLLSATIFLSHFFYALNFAKGISKKIKK